MLRLAMILTPFGAEMALSIVKFMSVTGHHYGKRCSLRVCHRPESRASNLGCADGLKQNVKDKKSCLRDTDWRNARTSRVCPG